MFYQINYGQLLSDAFFIRNNRLMFASIHGREADVLSLIATLSDGGRNLGYGGLTFEHAGERRRALYFSNLTKKITKYEHPEYGALTHCFIYDEDLQKIDYDRKKAWLLLTEGQNDEQALMNLVRHLSDVPLLHEWLPTVTAQLTEQNHIERFISQDDFDSPSDGIYNLAAFAVKIPDDMDEIIKRNLQEGLCHA